MATFLGINNVGVNGLPIFAVYTYRREIVRFCIENDAWQTPPVELIVNCHSVDEDSE